MSTIYALFQLGVRALRAGSALASLCETEQEYIAASAALAWARSGFQVVEPTPLLAASLAASTGLTGLKMPWPAWAIRLTAPLITFPSRSGDHVVDVISVADSSILSPEMIAVTIRADGGRVAQTTCFESLDTMAATAEGDLTYDGDAWADHDFSVASCEAMRRASLLALRLVLGAIAELDGGISKRRTALLSERAGTRPSDPKLGIYVLARPVKLDARQACLEYIRGGGRAPSVRTLVRGHWKRQPVGTARSDRKWIHVEPYWRGPEHAAVAVRPHVIKERDECA